MSLSGQAGNATRPDEAEWINHRETITRLYSIEDRDLKDVQKEMKLRYGFEADKYEYEKHFKQWNLRKNLKKEEWMSIIRKIHNRKIAGKDSEVFCQGVLIPTKRVRRSIKRYRVAAHEPCLLIEKTISSPKTPEGILVTTPKDGNDSSETYHILPISQFFAAILQQVRIPRDLTVHSPSSTSGGMSMPKVIQVPIPSKRWAPLEVSFPDSGMWIPDLTLNFYDACSEGRELLRTAHRDSDALRALHLMVFVSTNGYLDTTSFAIQDVIVRWLGCEAHELLLRQLLSVGGSTASAMLKTLYPFAIEGQNARIVKIFLDFGCDPGSFMVRPLRSAFDSGGLTVLGYACQLQNIELMQVLLEAGADPNAFSKNFQIRQPRTLSCGFELRQIPMVLILLGQAYMDGTPLLPGRKKETITFDKETDKLVCCSISLLIKYGASVNGDTASHSLPLIEAIRFGSNYAIRLLLGHGANVNLSDGQGELPLFLAIEKHNADSPTGGSQSLCLIQLLLEAGADVNGRRPDPPMEPKDRPKPAPFDLAAKRGSLDIIRLLYSAGGRPSRLALAHAIESGNEDIVRSIIEIIRDESNNIPQQSALLEAIKSKNVDIFNLIYEFENVKDSCSMNDLISVVKAAIDCEMDSIIPYLLAEGRHFVEFPESLGPAMLSAAASGKIHSLDLLISEGAKPCKGILREAFRSKSKQMIMRIMDLGETIWHGFGACHDKFTSKITYGTVPTDDALISAVGFGDLDILRRVLEQDEVRITTEVLLQAIIGGDVEVARILLEAGSPVNEWVGHENSNPLQCAVKMRHVSLVRMLLDYGANPDLCYLFNLPGSFGSASAPQFVVKQKDYEIADMLIQAGANMSGVPRTDNHTYGFTASRSALLNAVLHNNQDLVDFVLSRGADPTDSAALSAAAEQGNITLVEFLLRSSIMAGRAWSVKFATEALCVAVGTGSIDLVKLLLAGSMDPNKRSHGFMKEMTALGVAITATNGPVAEIIEALLQAGADPNGIIDPLGRRAGRRTALVAAAEMNHVSTVTLLVKYGANPNAHPKATVWRSPLQAACEAGAFGVVRLLLDQYNVDVNAPGSWYSGATALQLAAIAGNVQLVLNLLEYGADINAPSAGIRGRTALEGAAEHGRLDTIRALLNAGVRIDGPYEKQYRRALRFAERRGDRHIVQELLTRAGH